MKLSMLVAGAAVLSVAALTTMPAAAQDVPSFSAPSFYGNLGYTAVDSDDVTLGALGGRLGAKFHPNFGAEAEAAFGVKSDDVNVGGVNVKAKLKYSAAVYAVGFLPVTDQFDLLARVGYGTTKLKGSAAGVSASDSDESWNYGVGAQYTFDGLNGVRGDYTRHDFGSNGGDADVWTIAYVRKF